MSLLYPFYLLTLNVLLVYSSPTIYTLEEEAVCSVKTSCSACLQITVCSWCETENKCFSEKTSGYQGFCKNNTIKYLDQGLSYLANAECACAKGEVEKDCLPPGVSEDSQQCLGRGTCTCGRCFCDATPDKEHPDKVITGKYCEYDNFSCVEADCNEGPYSLLEMEQEKADNSEKLVEEQPVEN